MVCMPVEQLSYDIDRLGSFIAALLPFLPARAFPHPWLPSSVCRSEVKTSPIWRSLMPVLLRNYVFPLAKMQHLRDYAILSMRLAAAAVEVAHQHQLAPQC